MGSLQEALLKHSAAIQSITGSPVVEEKPKQTQRITYDVAKNNLTTDKLQDAESIREFRHIARSLLINQQMDINEVIQLARQKFETSEGFKRLNATLYQLRTLLNADPERREQNIRTCLRKAGSKPWKK